MPPWCQVGVPSQIRAEARGANQIPDGVVGVFRVGEVEGARDGLKAKGVVVHIQRCEGNSVGTLLRNPPGGRLDGVQHM